MIGQQRTKDFLASLAASERVPHALLFLSPTGGGGLALATAFAQLLQCEQYRNNTSAPAGLFESDPPITNPPITNPPITNPPITNPQFPALRHLFRLPQSSTIYPP